MDFRKIVQEGLHQKGMRPADLVSQQVGKQSIYDYLGGKSGSISSATLEAVFDKLGLVVVSATELEHLRDRAALVAEARDAVASILRRVVKDEMRR